jgi:hypothetical protein
MFAAFIMIMLEGWWIIVGLVALVNEDFYVVTREYIFRFDATAWGWTHLAIGILLLLAGLGLFRAGGLGPYGRRGHGLGGNAGRLRVAALVSGLGDPFHLCRHLHHVDIHRAWP